MIHSALYGAKACIFDAGGTIVHPDWPRLSQIAAEVSDQTFTPLEMARAFSEMLRLVGIEMQREGFVLPDEMKAPHWTFRRMFAALGLDGSTGYAIIERLNSSHAARHIWCGPDESALRVLKKLKREGLLLAVISNTEDGRLSESLEAAGISEQFDLLIDSHLVGHRKPDQAIFNLTLKRLGLKPDEAAYIGDSYVHDALAARAVGLRGILLDPHDLHPESVCPRIKSLEELSETESSNEDSSLPSVHDIA